MASGEFEQRRVFGQPFPGSFRPEGLPQASADVQPPVKHRIKDLFANNANGRHSFFGGRNREHQLNGGVLDSVVSGPSPKELEERKKIAEIRRFTSRDILPVLHLFDPEALGHLAPPPHIPDWNNPDEIHDAMFDFYEYARNGDEDPKKFTPVVAVNSAGEIMAFAGIRLRGDPYVPVGERIASLERLVVGEDFRGEDVATEFVASLAQEMFTVPRYGRNGDLTAVELRAWTMEDEIAGDWRKNHGLMKKIGFQPKPDANWPDYREKRNLPDDGRGNATWWRLRPDVLNQRIERGIISTCSKINLQAV